jgi:hypothetical protein
VELYDSERIPVAAGLVLVTTQPTVAVVGATVKVKWITVIPEVMGEQFSATSK